METILSVLMIFFIASGMIFWGILILMFFFVVLNGDL